MRRIAYLVVLLLLLAFTLPAERLAAQDDQRCFPETDQCISGAIRAYWERNGGLPVFGYPISYLQTETIEGTWTGPTQWFERDRLEDHSAQGLGVLAGRLGAQYLEMQGRPWTQGTPPATAGAGCRIFPQTGYQVCGLLLSYWQRQGGLERFGYPITDQHDETIAGKSYSVQYFERRRAELHPENAAPYNVLLGLLGNEIHSATCSVPVIPEFQYGSGYDSSTFGCPVPGQDYQDVNGAQVHFERGEMYWIKQRGGTGLIFVVIYGPNNALSYQRFEDTWSEGQPLNSGLEPPSGLLEPARGFGKVWREQAGIRDALGWATEEEQGVVVSYQEFQRGALLRIKDSQYNRQRTWQFYPDGHATSMGP
jgi:hypothetical protein